MRNHAERIDFSYLIIDERMNITSRGGWSYLAGIRPEVEILHDHGYRAFTIARFFIDRLHSKGNDPEAAVPCRFGHAIS